MKLDKTAKQMGRKIKELNLTEKRENNDSMYFEDDEIEYIKDNWEKCTMMNWFII